MFISIPFIIGCVMAGYIARVIFCAVFSDNIYRVQQAAYDKDLRVKNWLLDCAERHKKGLPIEPYRD